MLSLPKTLALSLALRPCEYRQTKTVFVLFTPRCTMWNWDTYVAYGFYLFIPTRWRLDVCVRVHFLAFYVSFGATTVKTENGVFGWRNRMSHWHVCIALQVYGRTLSISLSRTHMGTDSGVHGRRGRRRVDSMQWIYYARLFMIILLQFSIWLSCVACTILQRTKREKNGL